MTGNGKNADLGGYALGEQPRSERGWTPNGDTFSLCRMRNAQRDLGLCGFIGVFGDIWAARAQRGGSATGRDAGVFRAMDAKGRK